MTMPVLGQSGGSSLFYSNTNLNMALSNDMYDFSELSKAEVAAPQLIMLANVALTGEVNGNCCDYMVGEERQMAELTTVGNTNFSDSDGEGMDDSQRAENDSEEIEDMDIDLITPEVHDAEATGLSESTDPHSSDQEKVFSLEAQDAQGSIDDKSKGLKNKPFHCKPCQYEAESEEEFVHHIRTHTGERPYRCSMCPYSSSQKTHLTRHMRTHSGEKPFKCEQCSYVASNQHEVTRHARQVYDENINTESEPDRKRIADEASGPEECFPARKKQRKTCDTSSSEQEPVLPIEGENQFAPENNRYQELHEQQVDTNIPEEMETQEILTGQEEIAKDVSENNTETGLAVMPGTSSEDSNANMETEEMDISSDLCQDIEMTEICEMESVTDPDLVQEIPSVLGHHMLGRQTAERPGGTEIGGRKIGGGIPKVEEQLPMLTSPNRRPPLLLQVGSRPSVGLFSASGSGGSPMATRAPPQAAPVPKEDGSGEGSESWPPLPRLHLRPRRWPTEDILAAKQLRDPAAAKSAAGKLAAAGAVRLFKCSVPTLQELKGKDREAGVEAEFLFNDGFFKYILKIKKISAAAEIL